MPVFLFQAKSVVIIGGKAHNTARFNDWKKENPERWMRLEPDRLAVSDELRGYYFGAIIPTVKATVPEWQILKDGDIHEILKKLFNSFKFFNPITKRTEVVGRTAVSGDSSTRRAMDYLDKIRAWMAEEYFVELPSPEEYRRLIDSAQLK